MNPLPTFPPEVYRYVRAVFRGANRRIAEKIALVPNCPEPSLDMTLIEHLSRYSGANIVTPGWAVRIDVHYLGGLRHFYRWEIADIGLMVFAKKGSTLHSSKVALLQSKRLYPEKHGIIEETDADYHIGMGRLLPDIAPGLSLAAPHKFAFEQTSAYEALKKGDDQYKAIEQYEAERKFPVHYLLYNPWAVQASYQLPVVRTPKLGAHKNGGARVIPATTLRHVLSSKPHGYSPTFQDFATAISRRKADSHGWRLEDFVAGLMMRCKQGALFGAMHEDNVSALFNRRSGPISAAVGVTVEQVGADAG